MLTTCSSIKDLDYWNMAEIQNEFGDRLRQLRKEAGYTQTSLGEAVGASRRTIAYYEKEAQPPPAHLLIKLSEVLGVSTEVLLGTSEQVPLLPRSTRLARRMAQIEKLPPNEKKQLLQIIDSFIERASLRSA